MSDIAEMMLDGTLCECCGVYIEEGEAEGFPRRCDDCGEFSVRKKAKVKVKINKVQRVNNRLK